MAGDVRLISSFITERCLGMVIVVVEPISAKGVDPQRAIWCPVNASDLPVLIVEVGLVEIGREVLV